MWQLYCQGSFTGPVHFGSFLKSHGGANIGYEKKARTFASVSFLYETSHEVKSVKMGTVSILFVLHFFLPYP